MNETLQLLLHLFAGWVSRQQLDVIDYLCEENRVLREQLGGRRLRLTAAYRRMLKDSGVKVVRLPARSPNLNAQAERFVLAIKSE